MNSTAPPAAKPMITGAPIRPSLVPKMRDCKVSVNHMTDSVLLLEILYSLMLSFLT